MWRHGYVGRVTQDVDILLPLDQVEHVLQAASVARFEVLRRQPGRWPKMIHKDTGIGVDILPEGERPGTPSHPAPPTLPAPSRLGAAGHQLRYISLPGLVELKLAAGRARDEADIIELIRANPGDLVAVRTHLQQDHADYVATFDHLLERAKDQQDH